MKERRKNKRFPIPFHVEVIPSQDTSNYVMGEVRDFSPDGFSFEAENIALETNNAIDARFQVDPESGYINIAGRVVWKIQFGNDCQVGLEIAEIDMGSNTNLGFPFDMWTDKIKSK